MGCLSWPAIVSQIIIKMFAMKMKKERWLWEGGSGKLLGKVYYKRNGQTFARKAPGSYNKIPTQKQAAARERFMAANQFAKSILADPVLKALYEQNLGSHISAYSKAVSEYMKGVT